MKVRSGLVAAAVAATMFLGAGAAVAHADQGSDIATLARLGRVPAGQVKAAAQRTAQTQRRSVESVLSGWVKEAQTAKAAVARARGNRVRGTSSASGDRPLGYALSRGDVFVSTSGFLWYGHTGIFVSSSSIVHAPGNGQNSVWVNSWNVMVGAGSVQDYVAASPASRDSAANFAINYLRGKPYNLNFWDNHRVWASNYNCSQLVWAAYAGGSGIDLDGNGGSGVYPWDIDASGWTRTYRVY